MSQPYDVSGYAYDCEVYCSEDCLPEDVTEDSEEVSPVFASSEWDYKPCCSNCGEELDVQLTEEGEHQERVKRHEKLEEEWVRRTMLPDGEQFADRYRAKLSEAIDEDLCTDVYTAPYKVVQVDFMEVYVEDSKGEKIGFDREHFELDIESPVLEELVGSTGRLER